MKPPWTLQRAPASWAPTAWTALGRCCCEEGRGKPDSSVMEFSTHDTKFKNGFLARAVGHSSNKPGGDKVQLKTWGSPGKTIWGKLTFQRDCSGNRVWHIFNSVWNSPMWVSLDSKASQPMSEWQNISSPGRTWSTATALSSEGSKALTAQRRPRQYQKAQTLRYLPWLVLGSQMVLQRANRTIASADDNGK